MKWTVFTSYANDISKKRFIYAAISEFIPGEGNELLVGRNFNKLLKKIRLYELLSMRNK